MASYGRNFDFRVPPVGGQRSGRFVLGGDTDLPIGTPVIFNGDAAAIGTGSQEVELASANTEPLNGLSGIVVYENFQFVGDDPFLTTYSDKDKAPAGAQVQVVSGTTIKVAFTNTEDRTFLETRNYDGRVMVAGIGIATPTVEVGDFLTPGAGNDTAGYWKKTSDPDEAWFVVTAVDNDRGLTEARMTF